MVKFKILHDSNSLFNTIREYPDLPVVFMTNVGDEVDYPYIYSAEMHVSVTHILTCGVPSRDSHRVFDDWDEIQGILTSWCKSEYTDGFRKKLDSGFAKYLEETISEYREYWREVILVRLED